MGRSAKSLVFHRPGRDGKVLPNWYAYRFKGRRWAAISTGTTSKREAEQIARHWRREGAARIAGVPQRRGVGRCSLAEAIDRKLQHDAQRVRDGELAMRSLKGYMEKCRRLLEHWPEGTLLAEVDAPSVDAWIARRLASVSRSEVTKEKQQLGHVLKLAKRAGLWDGDVAAIMPVAWKTGYVPRDRWLTMAQADALLAVLPLHKAAVVAMALGFAASPGPARAALWGDWDGSTMLLRDTKNARRWRRVPVLAHAARYTTAALWWLQRHGSMRRWPDGVVSRDLGAACARAGIEHCTLTDMRRSACHWMLHAGMPEHVAARYMGHASSAMVRTVYGRATSGEALAELVGDFAVR